MLPYPYEPNQNGITYPCYIQPKLNGIRALYQVGHFQAQLRSATKPGRTVGVLITLRHLNQPLSKIFGADVILDGVLYIHGWSPEQIEQAIAVDSDEIRVSSGDQEPGEIEYHVFDVVNFNRSFESRFMAPASILTDTQHLHKAKVVETHRLLSAKPVTYFYDKWLDAGYDGLIYRLNGCPYVSGKSKNLLYRQK